MGRWSIGGAVVAGQWSHLAASWDGSGINTGIHLYLDGNELAYAFTSDRTGARPDDSAVDLSINTNSVDGLAGVIDDLRLYDRVLSAAEVRFLFDAMK